MQIPARYTWAAALQPAHRFVLDCRPSGRGVYNGC